MFYNQDDVGLLFLIGLYLHSLHYKKVNLFTFPTLQEGDFIYIPYITRRWFYLHSLHYKKVILFKFKKSTI